MNRFTYLLNGILCLMLVIVVGYHLGNQTVQAQAPFSNPDLSVTSAPSGIVAMYGLTDMSARFLDENGAVWKCYVTGSESIVYCWERLEVYDIPIPASQIKFWTVTSFVTQDDHVFMFRDVNDWHDCGLWPGGSVPTNDGSWGTIKQQQRGNDR